MRRNLFWLDDEQWQRIEPLLPEDVRVKTRIDDRRIISDLLHVIKNGCRWCDCSPEYSPTQPSTIVSYIGRSAVSGNGCSVSLLREADLRTCR